jgi:hypothetical protein
VAFFGIEGRNAEIVVVVVIGVVPAIGGGERGVVVDDGRGRGHFDAGG